MYLFESISYNEDIFTVLRLKIVCKRWENVFSESSLTVATILHANSVKGLVQLPNLQSLFIKTSCIIPGNYFKEYLSGLVTFKICVAEVLVSDDDGKLKITDIWDCMKKLKILELYETTSLFETFQGPLFPIINNVALESLTSLEELKLNELNKNTVEFFPILKSLVSLKRFYVNKVKITMDQTYVLQLIVKDFLGKYEDSLFSEVVFVEYR